MGNKQRGSVSEARADYAAARLRRCGAWTVTREAPRGPRRHPSHKLDAHRTVGIRPKRIYIKSSSRMGFIWNGRSRIMSVISRTDGDPAYPIGDTLLQAGLVWQAHWSDLKTEIFKGRKPVEALY